MSFIEQIGLSILSSLKVYKQDLSAQDYVQDSIAALGTDIATSALLQAIQTQKESYTGVEVHPKIIMTYANGFSVTIEENTTFPYTNSLSTALLVSIDLDSGLPQNQ